MMNIIIISLFGIILIIALLIIIVKKNKKESDATNQIVIPAPNLIKDVAVNILADDYKRQLDIVSSNLNLGIIDRQQARRLYQTINDNAMKDATERINALEEQMNEQSN